MRPVPDALARLPEVRLVRWTIGVVLVGFAVGLPHFLSVDRSLKASAVLIYGVLALSLVVLTGWAGQVSLGQVAFFAIGAVVGAWASIEYNVGPAGGHGAGADWPAPQQRWLSGCPHCGSAASTWRSPPSPSLSQPRPTCSVPGSSTGSRLGRVPRNPLFGRISIDSPTRIYYVALVVLLASVLALRGIRRSRSGRVLVALRENERAAEAYGVQRHAGQARRLRPLGWLGLRRRLRVRASTSRPSAPSRTFRSRSFVVFVMAVIGGIGSIPGALLGALYIRGAQWFLPSDWQFLASGVGVLIVLLVAPAGLGGLLQRGRDLWLRSVARRNGLFVPGFSPDVRDPDALPSSLMPADEIAARAVGATDRSEAAQAETVK